MKLFSRKFLADTLAMITFSIIVKVFVELIVAKVTLLEYLGSCVVGTAINLIIGRPYGWLRDKVFAVFVKANAGRMKKLIVDTLIFVATQMPIYFLLLLCIGVDFKKILVACTTLTVIIPFLAGRPYGVVLDLFRRFFKINQE